MPDHDDHQLIRVFTNPVNQAWQFSGQCLLRQPVEDRRFSVVEVDLAIVLRQPQVKGPSPAVQLRLEVHELRLRELAEDDVLLPDVARSRIMGHKEMGCRELRARIWLVGSRVEESEGDVAGAGPRLVPFRPAPRAGLAGGIGETPILPLEP